ncbi:MAG: NAD(P)-dependent oxidoreductase [Bacteroidetes bacterium]|nr:NAD(P)-dependent oxidoreductase [Bacteroidota bacterium]
MPATKKLLLTGATGFIGSHVQNIFFREGWEVTALARKIPERKINGVKYIPFDFENPSLPGLGEQFDAFIHAGYVKQQKGKNISEINLKATKFILDHLKGQLNCHQIFISSLSSKENALSEYGKQKFEIEKLFSGKDSCVVRAGLVLGNGGLFSSMKKYLEKKNIIPLFGDGKQPVQTVHIDDLVHAIRKISNEKQTGKFVIAEDEPIAYREFYSLLCEKLGKKPRFVRAGFGIASFLISTASSMGIELPVTKDNLLGLKQMEKVSSKKDLEKLGIELRSWKESLLNCR